MGENSDIKHQNTPSRRWCLLCALWLGQELDGKGKGGSALPSVFPWGVWIQISHSNLYIQASPKKKRRVLRSISMLSGRPFRWARKKWVSFKSRKKSQGIRHFPFFLEHLGPVLLASSKTGRVATVRVSTLNVFQSSQNPLERSQI